jgi:hypothetical protein
LTPYAGISRVRFGGTFSALVSHRISMGEGTPVIAL